MPPKNKGQKKDPGGRKKRKNISPLFADNAHDGDYTAGSTGTGLSECVNSDQHKTVSNNSKRFHLSSPEHFVFDNMSMNYQQPCQNPAMQSPQGQFAPYYMPAPVTSSPQTAPPQWAISLIDNVNKIMTKMDKIDALEKSFDVITSKLTSLETKVDVVDQRVAEVERSCTFVSKQFDDQAQKLRSAETEIKHLQDSCTALKTTMESLEKDRDRMRDRVLDGEYRSMRDNLIFYGMPETGSTDMAPENACEEIVKSFISDDLKVDTKDLVFDRAHRLGAARNSGSPRPVIVKFHYYNQREIVRKAAWNLRMELKARQKGVGVQLPKEWRDARKSLQDVFQSEKRKGSNVRFIGEKLYVNGQLHKPSTSHTG